METRASTLPALPSLLPERLPSGPPMIGQWACSAPLAGADWFTDKHPAQTDQPESYFPDLKIAI